MTDNERDVEYYLRSTVYRTTQSIENPVGDDRTKRRKTSSPLERKTIPAGFVFSIAADGSIEDRTRPSFVLDTDKSKKLHDALLKVASPDELKPVEPPVEESIKEILDKSPDAIALALEALGITPQELKRRLQGQTSPPKQVNNPSVVPGPAQALQP